MSSSESEPFDFDQMPMPVAQPKKPRKKGEMRKRIWVGAFILSMYCLTYNIGVFYQSLFALFMQYMVVFELIGIARDEAKDKKSGISYVEHFIWITACWGTFPFQYGNFKSLQASGVTQQSWPTLYAILFDWHYSIWLFLCFALFVTMALCLKKSCYRYQLS